jgi:hypothetical protein
VELLWTMVEAVLVAAQDEAPQQTILRAKILLTLRLVSAPLIAIGTVATFRLRSNPSRRPHEHVGRQLYGSRMRPVHAPQ